MKVRSNGIQMGHIVGLIEGGTFPFTVCFAVLVCRALGEVMVNFKPKCYVNIDGTRVRVGNEVETQQAFDYNTGFDYLADRPYGGVPRVDREIATDAVIEVRIGCILDGRKQTLCLEPRDICWLAGKISERGGAKTTRPRRRMASVSANMVDEYRQMLDVQKKVEHVRKEAEALDELKRQAMGLADLIQGCLTLVRGISETRLEIRNSLSN